MPWGPVEWIVIEFPGSRFTGEIIPALAALVNSGTVRIIDLLVVHKDDEGAAHAVELDALDPDESALFEPLDGEVLGLLSDEDVAEAAADLAPGSTAALLVWENVWATTFATAVRDSGGRLVAAERVSHEVVEAAVAAAEADMTADGVRT